LRILHINFERGYRGGERQTLLLLGGLRTKGIEVELLARTESDLAMMARAEGHLVHTRENLISALSWFIPTHKRYQVVHAHTANAVTLAILARPAHRSPVIFTRRTNFSSHLDLLRKIKWRYINKIVAVSESAASYPIRLGFDTQIIYSSVPNVTADIGRTNQLIERHNLRGKKLIGTAGVFNADKDPFTLIRAAAILCKSNDDIVFLHWGVGGPLEQTAKQLASELGLSNRYLFLGFMKNPEQLFGALSTFVLASRIEALGTSLIDAMMASTPVIGTRIGGIRELLGNDRGLAIQPENPAAIADAISWVLTHPTDAQTMATRAFLYAQLAHSTHAMTKQYIELYDQLH